MNVKQIHIEKYDFDAFEKEQKPFTMIRTDVIQKISVKHAQEFLLWVYLESLPETWKPNKTHLTHHFNISDRTYERYMSWLNAVGLIEYRQTRSKGGTFGKGRLLVLNGSKFNPDADVNGTVNVDGTVVNKCNKAKVIHISNTNRPDKNGVSEKIATTQDPSTFLKDSPNRQITEPRLDDAHIKTTKRNRKAIRKTNTQSVSVFSDKETIKNHIHLTIANREIFVDEDIVDQIVFYIGDCRVYDEVVKKINIALKKVREGKWNIPHRYKGITSQSLREQEEEYDRNKCEQYKQEAPSVKSIFSAVNQGLGFSGFKSEMQKFKDDVNGNNDDTRTMPKKNIPDKHQIGS